MFRKAASKQGSQAVRAAKDLLIGSMRTPLNDITAARVDEHRECRAALQMASKTPPLKHRTIRRRVRVLRDASQPGPSSWRNGLIRDICKVSGGVQALSRWAQLWRRGTATDFTVTLWTAACVTPADCGWAPTEQGEPPQRKLRPIACAEALLKLVEGASIDECMPGLLNTLEPHQLGCGTPDGAPLIVYLVRSWAEQVGSIEVWDEQDSEEIALGTDLENAYGRAKKGQCA